MKIFAATLATETNTFTDVPTGKVDFEANGFSRREGSTQSLHGIGVYHAVLMKLAQARGHAVVESIVARSEEHTSELQSLMRSSYDVFCMNILIRTVHIHNLHPTSFYCSPSL